MTWDIEGLQRKVNYLVFPGPGIKNVLFQITTIQSVFKGRDKLHREGR